MGKGSNRFALLLTFMILVVSFGHTVKMYRDVGYGQYEAYTITVFIEGIFLLSTYTLSQNRIAGRKSGWPLKLGFGYGAVHVLFSNLHHSADLSYVFDAGYAGWWLGASVFVGLIVIELIVSYGMADGQDKKKTDSEAGSDTDIEYNQSDKDADSIRTVVTDEHSDNSRPDASSDNGHKNGPRTDRQTYFSNGNVSDSNRIGGAAVVDTLGADSSNESHVPPKTIQEAKQTISRTYFQEDADKNGQIMTVRKSDDTQADELTQCRADRWNRTDSKRTKADNGQRTKNRTDEKKKTSRKTVPDEVVEQVYLKIVEDTQKPPSFRELMRAAGCSKHKAGKIINRYKEQGKAV